MKEIRRWFNLSDVFSKVTAILLSSVLMFIAPVLIMTEENDRAMQTFVYTEIIDLTDRIRNTGCLTGSMYLNFLNALEDTGTIYDVEIQHFQTEDGIGLQMNSTEGILETLADDGVYRFRSGDVIKLKVKKQDGTLVGFYGGKIKDESY